MMKMLLIDIILIMAMIFLNACGGQITPTKATSSSLVPTIKLSQPTMPVIQPTQPSAPAEKEISFTNDVLPIFQEFSGACHGSSGGLSLETYEGVMKVVIPGQPEGSRLWKRLNGIDGPIMPLGGKLSDDLLQVIYMWIKQGAKNN